MNDMTQDMNCSNTLARQKEGSRKALAILLEYAWSKPRVSLEYAKSMARVWLEANILFPNWEKNKPTLGKKYSLTGNKQSVTGWLLHTLYLVFLVVVMGNGKAWGQTTITSLSSIGSTGDYIITDDINASGFSTSIANFSGTLTAQAKSDGTFPVISNLSVPIFGTTTDATISNIMLKDVSISQAGHVGAIAKTTKGHTVIYNCGILPSTSGSTIEATDGSNICAGSLVGRIVKTTGEDNTTRVINCFSYAKISTNNTQYAYAAGIVGYIDKPDGSSNSPTQDDIATRPMVMNCMFYGDITAGTNKRPVYGGYVISNSGEKSINNYNYFSEEDATFTSSLDNISKYNCTWPASKKNLTRFEYYRSILNSNKRLCTYWITGKAYGSEDAPTEADEAKIAKWVLDPSIAPYPILKKWGKYPSVINQDPNKRVDPTTKTWVNRDNESDHWGEDMAPDTEGQILGTVTVTIKNGKNPSSSKTPEGGFKITAMDAEYNDYCYGKIQLPYYNEIFGDPDGSTWEAKYGGNYTAQVVTGWEISDGSDATDFNFADRNSYHGRVFAQGGYFYVPKGVTSISITAHWADAVYLCNKDNSIDRVNVAAGGKKGSGTNVAEYGSPFTPAGTIPTTFQGQTVYTTIKEAIGALSKTSSGKDVYNQAIVLIGNVQLRNHSSVYGATGEDTRPFTLMSADLDFDNEPDNCMELQFRNDVDRPGVQPIRFDFLPVPELGLAIRTNKRAYAIGIMIPLGHFEITETAFMHTTQFEYDAKVTRNGKSPVIINGGEHEMFTKRKQDDNANNRNRTSYFLLGGNAWIHRFAPGAHPNTGDNPDIYLFPVNIIGGQVKELYLTGLYRPELPKVGKSVIGGAPRCYIDGGKFDIVAGAGYDKVKSGEDVIFKINHSLISEFYGGGINASNPVSGNIDVTIDNSMVDKYCGGPKVGVMTTGKTVTTHATGTTFGVFYGGGNGGNSYYRQLQRDGDFASSHIGTWTDQNYNWNGFKPLGVKDDGIDNKGYHAEYEFEVFNQSNGLEDQITQRGFIKWIQFGKTTTGSVVNELENCKVLGNFYGGGNLATVEGDVTNTLTNTKVSGDVFGAGYSATIPTFQVHDETNATFPSINSAGIITEGNIPYASTVYEWTNDLNGKSESDRRADPTYQKNGKWYCYTWNKLENLGTVTGKAKLIINGEETVVEKSVYGGGEESAVGGDTEVEVNAGTIGVANAPVYEAIVGNVYGGGKGKDNDKLAGLVKGNTNVTISGSPMIYHNIYGGGAYGSVGEFDYDATGMPTGLKEGATGGTCNVIITGGTIGTTGQSNGMVFGSSRGDVAVPGADGVDPNDRLAWVNNTNVVIGTQSATPDLTQPLIRGSVYGSGENGHTYNNTSVSVHGGTIGIASGVEVEDEDHNKYVGARYPYRGNVYGGGCGTDTYEKTEVVTEEGVEVTKKYTYYNFIAGIVLGNTQVSIDGGHIVHNVYGGGAMGSVGKYTFDGNKMPTGCASGGKCTVIVSGGDIGTDNMDMKAVDGPDDNGHVFGAGRGEVMDPGVCPIIEKVAYYNNTEVTINGKAFVRGSVFGGSESGHVLKDTHVIIGENNDSECQIGNGKGINRPYTSNEWATAETLEATNHWDYEDDGAPYDKNVRETGYYLNGDYAEGGKQVATDGHSFYGNVFGGGSGYYPYAQGKWLFSAGRVGGDTKVTINGGHILNNVYGGCEMSDVEGSATVEVKGGTVGVPRSKDKVNMNPSFGHVFGAGMGDKRIFFNTVTNVENTFVTVSGGRIYGSVHGGGEDGHVLKDAKTTISGDVDDVVIGSNEKTELEAIFGYDGNVFGGGQGSPTALTAGTVGGNVELNIQGGTMLGSVYGGGRIASVGPYFAMVTNPDGSPNPNYGKMQVDDENGTHGHIVVNLNGGIIKQNVYGGCMGIKKGFSAAEVKKEQFAISKTVTVNLNKEDDVADDEIGCVVKGNIFGCNNVNSSPQEDVIVNIWGTQREGATQIGNTAPGVTPAFTGAKVKGDYDVKGVYGGGNMAAYMPKGGNSTTYSTHVNINGCYRTSIQQVYGGGNAASTPATEVTVNGAYEIGELFGGGNGKDKISYDGIERIDNPGANVGFYEYEDNITDETATTDKPATDTPEKRAENYGYGSGEASVNIFGGYLHQVFGGSNTKGNVRKTAVTLLEEGSSCEFCVEEVYGGGKSAPMDAEAKLLMQCIPGLKKAYGGAEAADIQGGVTLNITNGTFDQVFGGNNKSGTIRGPIVVNIEETGCRPVIIGELYGGGNLAGYSVYGYKEEHVSETDPVTGEVKDVLRWVPLGKDPGDVLPSAPLYDDPVVNVKSFTSIGDIYGGGYGTSAVMVGNPTVNINVAVGSPETYPTSGDFDSNGFKEKTVTIEGYAQGVASHSVTLPNHKKGNIGAINNVFGGGNAAKVVGKTTVNIGTRIGEDEYMAVNVKKGDALMGSVYTYNKDTKEYEVTSDTSAVEGKTYFKKYEIKGVDIRGNVYGGGNQAEVTGDADVIIGKKQTTP